MKTILAIIATVSLSGCSYGEIYGRHISHPDRGFPITGNTVNGQPAEGYVNEFGFSMSACDGRLCFDSSIGYDLTSDCPGCMRGGHWLYEGRVRVRIFGNR